MEISINTYIQARHSQQHHTSMWEKRKESKSIGKHGIKHKSKEIKARSTIKVRNMLKKVNFHVIQAKRKDKKLDETLKKRGMDSS